VLVKQIDELHEIGEAAAQPIELVGDDEIDPTRFEIA
jgi:hypothetical protein